MIITKPDLKIQTFKFNGGEINVAIQPHVDIVSIHARISSSDELMELCLFADAYKRLPHNAGMSAPHLHLIYLPYARQDRVCNPGEAIGIKVLADIINMCGFKTVTLYDPHSDVAGPLFNNVRIKDQFEIWTEIIENNKFAVLKDQVVVAPDHGALKKSLKIAIFFGVPIYCANKIRDIKTGKILDIKLDTNDGLCGKDIFVFDDICDGGATFIELGKKIKKQQPKSMTLCITHGIFSNAKNVDTLAELYNGGLYCFDSWITNKNIISFNHVWTI